VKSTQAFQTRKKAYPLFGAYVSRRRRPRALRPAIVSLIASQVYSGMIAEDELHEKIEEGAFDNRARVYQDGLQVSSRPSEARGCRSGTSAICGALPLAYFAVLHCLYAGTV
jgi:hypothetical protein